MPAAQSALLTDLYQLNMLAACLDHGLTDTAVFELFVRKLPARRGFLMAAGLEQAALLRPFMRGGRRIAPAIALQEIRAHARDQLTRLPGPLRRLEPYPYAVEIGASLRSLAAQLDRTETAASAPPP